jgi:hypothetical protein
MQNKILGISAIMTALFVSQAYATTSTYNQTIELYNNSSNSIQVETGYEGNDIINSNKKWDCTGDPNSGSESSCVAISPGSISIPSKQSQVFTISSSVRSLPQNTGFLYGGVFFQIDPLNLTEGNIVSIPISANPIVAFASSLVIADGQPLNIGAAYFTNQDEMSPITSSVGIYGNGGMLPVYIVVNNNPLYTHQSPLK